MSAVAKGVGLSYSLITCSVTLHTAVEKVEGNKTACCGIPGKPTHDPVLVSTARVCSTCTTDIDTLVPYTSITKVREVGGGLVILEDTEIADAKQDALALKKTMSMTTSPAPEVEVYTMTGEKAYYLLPEPGHETSYAVLQHLIGGHPELAFLAQWTPRSNAALFRIVGYQGVLMATERVRPGAMKAVPQVQASAPAAMLTMADAVLTLPGAVQPFDPATYVDTYQDRLQALVASKQVVAAAGGQPTVATSAPALPAGQQAAMDALQAMLAAAGQQVDTTTGEVTAAPKKRAPRKAKASAA